MPPAPELLRKLQAAFSRNAERTEERLALGGDLDGALSGGLLRGAVTEIASSLGRARSTSVALMACAAAQRDARSLGGSTWCAWVDASCTLHAPGVAYCGVDLTHLLVVEPSRELLARVAVRVAQSRVFSVIVIDAVGQPLDRFVTPVRRLALAVEATSSVLVLMTDLDARRNVPLPTAARIELSRTLDGNVALRVAKERFGRIGAANSIVIGR